MHRLKETDSNAYNLKNCFGFDENDIDILLWNNSSILNSTVAPMEFQESKPYRLALYVRPSERRRLHKTKASLLVRNTIEKQTKNKKNESNVALKLAEKSQVKKSKRKQNIAKNVMLFEENMKTGDVSKKAKNTPEKLNPIKGIALTEVPCARKNILREINIKPLTKTMQNKTRRSYEKRCKEKEVENIVEPPSDEIIKEMEIKRLVKTKQKKIAKEEQEFEKWATNINSAFDDVEKFELSIAYD